MTAIVRSEIESSLVETFRSALMAEHHDDWDMETVSEAAHICARAWADRFFGQDIGSGNPMCDVCGGRGYVGPFSATHGAACPTCNGRTEQ